MRIEQEDRRWLVPKVTEEKWPREKFVELRRWLLLRGGLEAIKAWADAFGDYVLPGEEAPLTKRKAELIEASAPEQLMAAQDFAEVLAGLTEPTALTMADVSTHIRACTTPGAFQESNARVQHFMKKVAGVKVLEGRIRTGGRRDYIIMNGALAEQVEAMNKAINAEPRPEERKKLIGERNAVIGKAKKSLDEILPM